MSDAPVAAGVGPRLAATGAPRVRDQLMSRVPEAVAAARAHLERTRDAGGPT